MKNLFSLFLGFLILLSILFVPKYSYAYDYSKAPRWRRMPIIVFMPNDEEIYDYAVLMKKAIGEWQSRVGNKVVFYYTNNPRDFQLSSIRFKFIKIEGENAENAVTVYLDAGSENIRQANVTVQVKYDELFNDDANAKEENEKDLYARMLHAGGIILGLRNSTDENSIMNLERKENQTITNNDINNLATLYGTKPTVENNNK